MPKYIIKVSVQYCVTCMSAVLGISISIVSFRYRYARHTQVFGHHSLSMHNLPIATRYDTGKRYHKTTSREQSQLFVLQYGNCLVSPINFHTFPQDMILVQDTTRLLEEYSLGLTQYSKAIILVGSISFRTSPQKLLEGNISGDSFTREERF